jgi:putative ABC transport system substrate-binding protein
MRRREFITGLGSAAAWPVVTRAQQDGRVRRIGVLMTLAADDPETLRRRAAFVQGLQELGWANGRNLQFDFRYGGMPTAIADKRRSWSRLHRTSSWPKAV